jgi:hypothetical protein
VRILIVKMSPIEAITSSMFRTLAIARGLHEQGHQIDFLTVPDTNTNAKAEPKHFIQDINIIRTKPNNLFINASKTINQNKSSLKKIVISAARTLWHKLCIYDNTINIAKSISLDLLPTNKYDIVISSSDPKTAHIVVKRLLKQGLECGKWIQYWGDPLTLDITQKSIYPKIILKACERGLIGKADKIVYVSPFTLDEQKKLFPKYAKRMCFLPIAYMEKKEYPQTCNSQFVVGYYGDYKSNVRNIVPFYQACRELGDLIHADIIGDTDLTLESDANINVLPRGIKDSYEEKADLVVCILNSRGTQIPGKIYHEAGTNKAILVIVDGEKRDQMYEYLESFSRFIVCDNDVEAIKNAILKVIKCKSKVHPLEELHYVNISMKLIS